MTLEEAGVPTALICSDEFAPLARAESQARGMGAEPLVVIPHPVAGNGPEAIARKAAAIADEVVSVLSDPADQLSVRYRSRFLQRATRRLEAAPICTDDACIMDVDGGAETPDASALPPQASDSRLIRVEDSLEAVNDRFYTHGWTDGLPIVPPTVDRVERMVAWSDRAATEELRAMPPRQGLVTIEKLAVNAVMAGCRPEYFPVIIAAVEALLEEPFNLYAVQSTTHPCAPLLIVNGPIARELDVNSRYNAFGPGWRANATIGRALRLILLNLGGGAPGILDRATQGQPAKYSYCIAENEADNPWLPLHVERGFDRMTSTVTVCGAENPHNLSDHASSSAQGLLTTFASTMASMGANNAYAWGESILALGPEHAALFACGGLDKAEIRGRLLEQARISRPDWERGGSYGLSPRHHDMFAGQPSVPVFLNPEDLLIIVVGAAGRHSCWIPTFGAATKSVTRAITLTDGTPAQSVEQLRRR